MAKEKHSVKIQLSDHFSWKRMLRFALPTILMLIVTSVYGVVDGFFVSNYAGKTPFAAVNFIMPYVMIISGFGFMFGAGGCALIGKTLGEGKKERANGIFSMLTYTAVIFGIIAAVIGVLTVESVAGLLGAEGELKELCGQYGRIVLSAVPFAILQYEFHSFYVVAEKPNLGLVSSILAGVANIILDFLLVGVFSFGIKGAAAATGISQAIAGIFPLIYFSRKNSSLLRFGKAKFEIKVLVKTVTNGASEFVSNIAMSVVGMLYNVQLLKYLGENGVSAYGVLMYVSLVFSAIFLGFSVGTAPITSFHYGAQNKSELRNLRKNGIIILLITSLLMCLSAALLGRYIARIFVGYDNELMSLTTHAFIIYAFSYLFSAIPVYGSSFFTALNDGFTSAAISFLRTMVFQLGAVLLLPLILGADGIWYSIIAAEAAATAVTVIFWKAKKKKYGY